MKIKEGFIVKKIVDKYMVISVGESAAFNKMQTMNETGAFLWDYLKAGCGKDELVAALISEYDVSEEDAGRDVDSFTDKLFSAGILEE